MVKRAVRCRRPADHAVIPEEIWSEDDWLACANAAGARRKRRVLSVYGRMVAAGEWRDYGISSLRDVAIFSVFRRTAEHPLYRIEKRPKLRGRQGQYAVIGMDGQILKRGSDLRTVLRVLERKLIRAVD